MPFSPTCSHSTQLLHRIFRKLQAKPVVSFNFPSSFARTLTYEEFDSVTFAYKALHPVIMSPIPVIDISPLWTLCDTGKLFIFLITRQSLHFQSRIDVWKWYLATGCVIVNALKF